MEITFKKIVKDSIFCKEFSEMKTNNVIIFDRNSAVVIYGPNGTGKTSLAKVLSKEEKGEYVVSINGVEFSEKNEPIAHVIFDQNDRNVIVGSTEDFILGDNITREYELKSLLDHDFNSVFSKLINELKSTFGIEIAKSNFNNLVGDKELLTFIESLANKKSKGSYIEKDKFINHLMNLKKVNNLEYDDNKFKFFVEDYKKQDSVLRKIIEIKLELDDEEKKILKIDENKEAVRVLEKFNYLNDCVVCDKKINRVSLLTSKHEQRERNEFTLSVKAKSLVSDIMGKLETKDPFFIGEVVRMSLSQNDLTYLEKLREEIQYYFNLYPILLENFFADALVGSNIVSNYSEYSKLVKEKPYFQDEDILFVEKFLNECLERKIKLERGLDNNLKLTLGDREFLNQDRRKLSLSNGEQNFLSITFELLKAKKSSREIVVLDDPISSFDSIYKNKIAFAILKFLSSKKVIITTHNTDLIKLLEHQKNKSFKLYFLNNTKEEENGFIEITEKEIEILMYIPKFLELLRCSIKSEINDELIFLVSLIPFLRGYSILLGKKNEKDQLTKLMHGYETEEVNLTELYNSIIGPGVIEKEYKISAIDILNMKVVDVSDKGIFPGNYPLLYKTLSHTFTYLYLRLSVENKLVSKFSINTKKHDLLAQIVAEAFKGSNPADVEKRVFFLSRKTLLNEFNHFEMDMNIFQPAIDITNQSLTRERDQILEVLSKL